MLKKLFGFFITLITSGILFHRSSVLGILGGVWAFAGAGPEDSIFKRMFTPDLILFIVAFLLFYRLLFVRVNKEDGSPDFHTMGVYLLGDVLWAFGAMFCTIPVLMFFSGPGADYSDMATKAGTNPRALMKYAPRP